MPITTQDLERAIDGLTKITRGKEGEVIPLKLSKAEKAEFKEFTGRGFATDQSGKLNLFAAYSTWCDINKKPQVYFRCKAKYAHIELDMILTGSRLSQQAVQLIYGVFDAYCAYRNPKYPIDDNHVSEVLSYCDRIPKDKAEIVARQLAEIANNQSYWVV